LLAECRTIGGCPTGEARLTKGYRLPASYVIHTVGPVYRGRPQDSRLLADCYINSLTLALQRGLRTLAFPAISCGVYGYPLDDACKIAVDTCAGFLNAHECPERVFFMLFSANDLKVYSRYIDSLVG
jgi:O-acetyl-ADP-ribose deacetylase (regulator of RNase III)